MRKIICLLIVIISTATAGRIRSETTDSQFSGVSSEQLMREGRDYFEKREAGKALSRFLIVADRYQSDENREQKELSVRAFNNVGCVYKFFYYDYTLAYEYFNRAYELCNEIGYESFLPVILVNLGDLLSDYAYIYNSEGVLEEAEEIFNECFDKAMETGNWELLTTSFFNLTTLDHDIDLSKYDGIFSNKIPADTPDLEYVRLLYHGIKNFQEGRMDDARQYFRSQLGVINTQWEAARDTISAYVNIAATYDSDSEWKERANYLELALRSADNAGIIDLEADIARRLAECYDDAGQEELYSKYHSLYLEKRDYVHNARLANIVELKYVSDLRKEEERAREATMRNRFLKFITLTLVGVLVLIVVSTVLIWRNNRMLKAKNRSLFEKYRKALAAETVRKEEKYVRSNLDGSKKEELIIRINETMGNPDLICRDDFTLKELAQTVGSNTTYVSQVINETYGISFSTLLGNSRIKIACRRISEDPLYGKLTIEGMANSVGFKSRTTFINAFKREVGLAPSQYIKMAAAERGKD